MGTNLTEDEIRRMLAALETEPGHLPPRVNKARFLPLQHRDNIAAGQPISFLSNIKVDLEVQLGEVDLKVKEILELLPGSMVRLDKLAGEPVEVLINKRPVAIGEIVVINDMFGVRIGGLFDQKPKSGEHS